MPRLVAGRGRWTVAKVVSTGLHRSLRAVDADGHRLVFIIALPNPLKGTFPMADELTMALQQALQKPGEPSILSSI
jgi:hypothetical protein